jgi:ferredoxin
MIVIVNHSLCNARDNCDICLTTLPNVFQTGDSNEIEVCWTNNSVPNHMCVELNEVKSLCPVSAISLSDEYEWAEEDIYVDDDFEHVIKEIQEEQFIFGIEEDLSREL